MMTSAQTWRATEMGFSLVRVVVRAREEVPLAEVFVRPDPAGLFLVVVFFVAMLLLPLPIKIQDYHIIKFRKRETPCRILSAAAKQSAASVFARPAAAAGTHRNQARPLPYGPCAI